MNRYLKFNENNISKLILRYALVLICGISLFFILIYTPKYYSEYKRNIESQKSHLRNIFDQRIYFEIDELVKNIQYRLDVNTKEIENEILFDVLKLYGFITEEILKDQNPSSISISEYATTDSTRIHFVGNSSEIKLKTGNKITNYKIPDFGSKDLSCLNDENSILFKNYSEFISSLIDSGECHIRLKFSPSQKIFCGVAAKASDIQELRQKKLIEQISSMNLTGSQEYIFVYELLNRNGGKNFAKMLINPNRPDLEGKTIDDDYTDSKGNEFRKKFLKDLNETGSSKTSYYYINPLTKKHEKKTSFFKLIPELNWVIAQGYYQNQIDEIIKSDINSFRSDLYFRIFMLIILLTFFISLYYLVFRNFAVKIQETIIKYRSDLRKKNQELKNGIDASKQKNIELSEMKEKAEQASYEKSRFLANMSHEIRTPMNTINGMSNILSEAELTDEQSEIVETIKTSSDILLRILNDILDLSKIESGKSRLEHSFFDLNKLLNTLIQPFQFRAKLKGIGLDLVVYPENIHSYFLGDQVKLGQILNNLLGNAIKFTAKGNITLKVSLITESKYFSTIRFSIHDTGIGINQENLENIFGRFSQADISTTRKFGGSGLGLTISKKLVEMHGGDLKVNSIQGEGSEFFFIIKLKKSEKHPYNDHSINDREMIANNIKNLKILVAEDNHLNQKYISTLFSRRSINFKIVNNGIEVLEELEKNEYDIILMDGQMPEMDGITTTIHIRASNKYYKNIPIIALTASALIDEKYKFIDSGMNDYISKPIDHELLFKTILKYTGNTVEKLPVEEQIYLKNSLSTDKNITLFDRKEFINKAKIIGVDNFKTILKMYIIDVSEKIRALRHSADLEDIESLKFESHSLKGMALNFPTEIFNNLCIELDKTAIDENLDASKKIISKIESLESILISEIKKLVKDI